jgi:integrase
MKGYIRKRGANSWQLIYELPRDVDGRRKQGRQTVHGTKRDADAKLREILTSLDQGGYISPTKETLGAFLERWLATYAATNTRERTMKDYRGIVSRYLKPSLGTIEVTALRPEHVQGLYASMRERGLAAMTILHTHRLLKESLSHAVKWQLINRNVCDAVDAPRPQRKEMMALAEDDVTRLFRASEGTEFHPVFHVALHTGMRRSEVLALKWENIDLEHWVIQVASGLHRINGKGIMLTPTKNRSSRRTVAISEGVANLLRQVQGEQLLLQIEIGGEWNSAGFVFTDPSGAPLDPDRVTRAFMRISKSAGLTGLRLHDLRHTHATLMLKAGVPAKVVSERLGHASISTTIDIYSHVLPGMQEDAVAKFSRLLGDSS